MAMSSVAQKMEGCGEENISAPLILDGAYVCFDLSDVLLDSV
jgi:hypothetical protein